MPWCRSVKRGVPRGASVCNTCRNAADQAAATGWDGSDRGPAFRSPLEGTVARGWETDKAASAAADADCILFLALAVVLLLADKGI